MSRSENARRRALAVVVIGIASLAACSSSPKTRAAPAAVVLQSTDLPATYVAAGQWQPPTAAQRQQMSACLGTPTSVGSSETASAVFKGPGGLVATSVTDIYPSAAASLDDLHTRQGPAYTRCASGLVSQIFAVLPAGGSFGNLSVTPTSFPKFADGTVAYRFSLPVTSAGHETTAIADVVTVVNGAVEITVSFVGTSDPSAALNEPGVVAKILAGT